MAQAVGWVEREVGEVEDDWEGHTGLRIRLYPQMGSQRSEGECVVEAEERVAVLVGIDAIVEHDFGCADASIETGTSAGVENVDDP